MRFIIILIAFVVVSCGTTNTARPATMAEKNAALEVIATCLDQQAPKFDDGFSDASTIAQAIKSACHKKFMDYRILIAKNISNNYYRNKTIYDSPSLDESELSMALQAVLYWRKTSR